MALVLARTGACSDQLSDMVPQQVWDALYSHGLVALSGGGCPGADPDTVITGSGYSVLADLLRYEADGL